MCCNVVARSWLRSLMSLRTVGLVANDSDWLLKVVKPTQLSIQHVGGFYSTVGCFTLSRCDCLFYCLSIHLVLSWFTVWCLWTNELDSIVPSKSTANLWSMWLCICTYDTRDSDILHYIIRLNSVILHSYKYRQVIEVIIKSNSPERS